MPRARFIHHATCRGHCSFCGFKYAGACRRREHAEQHAAAACDALQAAGGKPPDPPHVPCSVHVPPVLAARAPGAATDPLRHVKRELGEAVEELAPRYASSLQPVVPPGTAPPPFTNKGSYMGAIIEYTHMFVAAGTRRCAAKYRYVGRVVAVLGVEHMRASPRARATTAVLRVRARWPQTPDFDKGEFVEEEEEGVLEPWPQNYGCENKHNQWVVYHGKTADEIQAGATVDLTQDDAMAKAAADAEALCAPLSLG